MFKITFLWTFIDDYGDGLSNARLPLQKNKSDTFLEKALAEIQILALADK